MPTARISNIIPHPELKIVGGIAKRTKVSGFSGNTTRKHRIVKER